MRLRQTSLQAYSDIQMDGTMGKQSYKIYKYLQSSLYGHTRNEISRILSIKINAVCGRVNELIKAGWFIETDKREDIFTKKKNYVIMAKCNLKSDRVRGDT